MRKPSSLKENLLARIAFFTHDTFGLGHIQRAMHLIQGLSECLPQASLLLITGSPALHILKNLPPNMDVVKIPTVVKTGKAENQPPHLLLSNAEIRSLRERIIRETLLNFLPDLFVVDNFPLGSQAELLPTLRELRRTKTRIVLGLRDILDAPEVVCADWQRQGIYDALDRYFDRILVYGHRKIFDPVSAYKLPHSIAQKVKFCGYVTAFSQNGRLEIVPGLKGRKEPFVIATGGGGGDAYPLLSNFLKAMQRLKDVSGIAVTGPLMGQPDREKLMRLARKTPKVTLQDFVPDLGNHLHKADAVVSMCGYNIAAEIVASGARAIMVPRTWRYGEHMNRRQSTEEREQIFRAKVLERFGLVKMIKPDQLTPERLALVIRQTLKKNRPRRQPLPIKTSGLKAALREILEMLPDSMGGKG